jgi:hypothetical protein
MCLIDLLLMDNFIDSCLFRMSLPTDYDYFSCFLDLLTYQKTEITDSISKMLGTRIPILEEGLLLCTFPLPTNNMDFKMYIRKLCHDPLVLEKFTMEIGNEIIIRCQIVYDTYSVLSRPLFKFPFKEFKNVENLQKQLKTLSFTHKVLKSHLFFTIMQLNGASTDIEFHYNATKDCFATSPSGHTYSQFIDKYKNLISSLKALYAAQNSVVPAPSLGQPPPFPQPPPPTLSSVPLAAATFPAASVTPHRAFEGESSRPRTVRRYIFGDPELQIRSRHGSDTVKPCATTTRLSATNTRIMTEIAASKSLACNSDMVEEMFQTRNSSTWNIARYGVMDLALRGIIPILDNRMQLEDNQDTGGEIDDISSVSSEVPQEKVIS